MRHFSLTLITAVLLLGLGATRARAAPSSPPARGFADAKLQAAFIYNFTKFVEWPNSDEPAEATFDIGVLGAPALAAALEEALAELHVGTRPVRVHRMAHGASLAAAAPGLEILFVGPAAADSLDSWQHVLEGHPVLTIGNSEDFWKAGGAIDFVLQKERMRFRVNLGTANRSGLKISSKLLALALAVEVDGPR